MDRIHKKFPQFELSYENIKHSKVPFRNSTLYLAVPIGKKFFVWFTYIDDKNVCLLLELNRYKNEYTIKNMFPISASFSSDLSLGTILYGTYILHEGIKVFVLENIYYYKGKNVSQYALTKKMTMFSLFFTRDIVQTIYHSSQLLFTMPYFRESLNEYKNELHTVPYRIYMTQLRSLTNYSVFTNYSDKSIYESKEKTLLVQPCIQNDIYELYEKDKQALKYVGLACINNYKTIIVVNSLFRSIKENIDLDTLELSDSEDEFENINEDKYVDLNKKIIMKCKYNTTFKLWEPISVVDINPSHFINTT